MHAFSLVSCPNFCVPEYVGEAGAGLVQGGVVQGAWAGK